jgi:tRNA(adenine34) deaminase
MMNEAIEFKEPSNEDIAYIRECMELAAEAEAIDEVPVGAMIVRDGVVLARAHNTRETSKCATHHAEILAIEEACRTLGGWRLPGVTLYVSMEPCAMCAGAIINARIPRVVYGAKDYRFGAFGSLVDLSKIPFNHIPDVVGGVLQDECSAQLSAYFRKKRGKVVQ